MSRLPGDSILDIDYGLSIDIDKIKTTWPTSPVDLTNVNMSSALPAGALDDVITIAANPNVSPGYLYTSSISGMDSLSWPKPSPKLHLDGEDADIEINGVSLTETLRTLQDRLNILRPNDELESRWHELRELRDQYQRLEAELLEKERAWEMLQSPS